MKNNESYRSTSSFGPEYLNLPCNPEDIDFYLNAIDLKDVLIENSTEWFWSSFQFDWVFILYRDGTTYELWGEDTNGGATLLYRLNDAPILES